jgi:hypothetical protein
VPTPNICRRIKLKLKAAAFRRGVRVAPPQ